MVLGGSVFHFVLGIILFGGQAVMEEECSWEENANMGAPSSKISSVFYGNPITRKLVQEFNTNTTYDFAKVIISPKTDGRYTMKMAFESGPFMFAFTFCLAGAVALTVLSVFILFRRLMVDDKYVASKTRVTVIITGYIFCILLCIFAAIVIIIGLTGLHQGIKLVRRNQTELSTVVSRCSKLLHCELDPAEKHINKEMNKYFAKIMRNLPFLKEEIKTLLKFFDYLHNIRLGIMKIHHQCKYLKPLNEAEFKGSGQQKRNNASYKIALILY
ncbi:hypothetical protein GCK32_005574 [Trichostrongylus colubriformis]|uniref:Uncharacterized protein n=1 Tax=Trichostrongylus colubriformis TaxID=6319 RepID=A0AAN8ENG6_TRICO